MAKSKAKKNKSRYDSLSADEKAKLEKMGNIKVDYPYINLRQYLKKRHQNHLLKYVTWNPEDSKSHRSKTLTNTMKSTLNMFVPDKLSIVIKNGNYSVIKAFTEKGLPTRAFLIAIKPDTPCLRAVPT